MSIPNALIIWPGNVAMSMVIWFVILVVALYAARVPAHRAILSLTRTLHNAMRLAAFSVMKGEKVLVRRNEEVLLAAGREAAERIIEREFDRIDSTVRRELSEYPSMHRRLDEVATKVDEDYQQSTVVPPAPPGWVKAVDAVARIPSEGDPMVANVLKNIHGSLEKAQNSALNEYRATSAKRHMVLKKMLPHWRKMTRVLGEVDKNVNSLLNRSKTIDRHMDEYNQIINATDRAKRMLSSSSLTQFFIAGFVLAIAIGGAMINFNLIARPMQEMVGGSDYIMGYKVSDIAALVIILVEIAMGLFLMESLRITRLFPVIAALDDKMRIRMVWASFIMLFLLATIESGLAFMREILSEQDAALAAELVSNGMMAEMRTSTWITTASQMGMGFILPFALTFVAIPLESFVHSSRTVFGIVAVATLRTLATLLRIVGTIFHYLGNGLVNVYDLVIFAPVWIEARVGGGGSRSTLKTKSKSEARTSGNYN